MQPRAAGPHPSFFWGEGEGLCKLTVLFYPSPNAAASRCFQLLSPGGRGLRQEPYTRHGLGGGGGGVSKLLSALCDCTVFVLTSLDLICEMGAGRSGHCKENKSKGNGQCFIAHKTNRACTIPGILWHCLFSVLLKPPLTLPMAQG